MSNLNLVRKRNCYIVRGKHYAWGHGISWNIVVTHSALEEATGRGKCWTRRAPKLLSREEPASRKDEKDNTTFVNRATANRKLIEN